MRKKIVIANWKMNKNHNQCMDFLRKISLNLKSSVLVIISPSFIDIYTALDYLKNIDIGIAAQNVNHNLGGAYTGEVSVDMLKSINLKYCIVGHSERRIYFGETNEIIKSKIKLLLASGIKPILCIGESIEDRNNNKYLESINKQIKETIFDLKDGIRNIIIAYEPIWAIGTGKTASSQQAEDMHSFIRQVIQKEYSKEVSETIPILYGGSCNSKNSKELFLKKNIDGGLIGSASLDADEFLKIINSF